MKQNICFATFSFISDVAFIFHFVFHFNFKRDRMEYYWAFSDYLSWSITFLLTPITFSILLSILRSFMPKQNLKNKYHSEWAFVSGATGGIGVEICKMLAQQNLNLVITAKKIKELDELKGFLETNYKIQVKTVAANLTDINALYRLVSYLKNFLKELKTKESEQNKRNKNSYEGMKIFVINHGAGLYDHFNRIPVEKKIKSYNLHVISTSYLAQFFVSHLRLCGSIDGKGKHRGLICLTSSIFDKMLGPYCSMYHIGKAYTTGLGTSLANEGALIGYDEITIAPSPVSGTKFYSRSSMKLAKFSFMNNLQHHSCSTNATTVASSIFRNAGRFSYVPVGVMAGICHSLNFYRFFESPAFAKFLRKHYKPLQLSK